MISREQKRKNKRELEKLSNQAKIDTLDWLLSLGHDASEAEIKAFKAGYIAATNRNK